jgi:hypothetical protein
MSDLLIRKSEGKFENPITNMNKEIIKDSLPRTSRGSCEYSHSIKNQKE